MTSSSLARRYARALMAIGQEDGRFEAYGTELARLEQAFEASAELRDLWLNPAYGKDKRMQVAESLVGPLGLSPAVANTLRLVVERHRVQDLPAITHAYRTMVDEKLGRVRATVTSAAPLSGDQGQRIVQALAHMTGKQITLTTKVDPQLIGGVVAQVGSTIIDGSLRTQLEALREQLRG